MNRVGPVPNDEVELLAHVVNRTPKWSSTNPVASFQGNEFDQRGPDFLRVVNVADIGAFEVQPPEAAPTEAIVITPKFTG